ncbi:helix-turn-helix transcriptional regulator [Tardiphaga sp. 1201_B9_N1_1]|uniref:helix-turn-helix transcriptional regulator n=1 Tax=unclassified Tardiphaga TaxID=2631404 RepID=UPI003F28C6C2
MIKSKLATFRKAARLTQQQLADQIGAHWTTISRLETGKLDLDLNWAERIAPALGVATWDLTKGPPPPENVFVQGGFGRGGLSIKSYENNGKNQLVLPPLFSNSWNLIEDDSFFPMFSKGDLIHLSIVTVEQAESILGRYAYAFAKDPDGNFFGVLARGKNKDSFCVRRPNMPDSGDFDPVLFMVVDAARFAIPLPDSFDPEPIPDLDPVRTN